MRLARRLWTEEAGFIISAELVLLATILVIGLIVGLVSLRNQIVQECVDVGQAFGFLSQSYAFSGCESGGTFTPCFGTAWTDACFFLDRIDFCQAPQTSGQEPGGISVRVWPVAAPLTPPGGEI